MEPLTKLISPKPIKTSNSCYSLRQNHLSKLQIKNNNNPNYGPLSSNLEIKKMRNSVQIKEKKDSIKNTTNFIDNFVFIEDYALELSKQDSEHEIFSIIDKEDKLGNSNGTKTSMTTTYKSEGINSEFDDRYNTDYKDFSFLRASLPPIRPQNPFFKNFDFENKDELAESIDNIEKCFSFDFQNVDFSN